MNRAPAKVLKASSQAPPTACSVTFTKENKGPCLVVILLPDYRFLSTSKKKMPAIFRMDIPQRTTNFLVKTSLLFLVPFPMTRLKRRRRIRRCTCFFVESRGKVVSQLDSNSVEIVVVVGRACFSQNDEAEPC